MKKVLIFFLALFSLLFAPAAFARDSEHIESYDTNIAIQKDGSIDITERIDYFFDAPRHGIFRNIPVIKTNDDGKKYKISLKGIKVTDEKGDSYTFKQTHEGDDEILKIGDADRTITGSHSYVISYSVLGALTYFPGHDELYWNSMGTKWQVPIAKAKTTVTLPQTVPSADLNAACFVGAMGDTRQDCLVTKSDTSVEVTVSRPLEAYEGATVVIGFPKGIVSVLEPQEVVPFFSTLIGKITLVILAVAAFLWYILAPVLVVRTWWRTGRDPKPAMGEVSAWFSPPRTQNKRDLTPAETGTLVDESADLRDIYATIVDLARRGYMKIIETKKGVFDFEKKKDWKDDKDILPFEDDLLSAIFKGNDRVSLKDLDLISTFEKIKKELYDSMVTERFFPENPQSIRTKYYVLAGLAFVTGNLILFLVATIFGRNMPKKTIFGAQAAAMGRSLKNFLVSQDKKLRFQAQKQMMFEKLLPYAIAFGVEEIWARRFEKLGLKQPDWYESSSGSRFNSVVFAHSVGRAATVSFASSVTSKSSSGFSSGFSGGGSSGGGGGGGGGGSW